MANRSDIQSNYNELFADDLTAIRATLETYNEVLNLMDWAIDSALSELTENGQLEAEDSILEEYRAAIKSLRKKGVGFRQPRVGQEAVVCPGCKALLKDVSGKKGERCSWCGYEFE